MTKKMRQWPKRPRDLPWPPKSVPAEIRNDEKQAGHLPLSTGHGGLRHKVVHGSTSWNKSDNQGLKRLEKSAMATKATTTREQRPPQPSTPVVLAPPHHGT
uniref:Uncharacterized protein n=1 Tax=Fagus sylvatica TaxID=28930 RepID=A0A2N9GEF0_FAGSY